MNKRKIVIIGSGFAGLSASCFLARAGEQVIVLEKQSIPGGRARQFKDQGFTFDMGPSWYWMPDVLERFFASFDKSVADYYELIRLDPSYRIYWPDGPMDVPADYEKLEQVFEQLEPGSSKRLREYLEGAAFKYKTGMQQLVYKPGRNLMEFMDRDFLKGVLKLDVFSSAKDHIEKYFHHPKIRQMMEFPLLFLGALPAKMPALYSLMNYADIRLGTWYPMGGMYRIISAMHTLATSLGVQFYFGHNAQEILVKKGRAKEVITDKGNFEADIVIGGADYHFIENSLLASADRSYSPAYWSSRVMAPSCLIFYIGLNKRLAGFRHHSLFFDSSFEKHAAQIYENPAWPDDPMFYVCCPSQSDATVAPEGHENLFILIPVANGLDDQESVRNSYFEKVIRRIEMQTGEKIKEHIVYFKSYAHSDFIHDYNAFKGNAYGLANTLRQTALLKPSIKSRKVDNLFYTGQLTVPGPGVPPSIISGEVVAKEVLKYKTAI